MAIYHAKRVRIYERDGHRCVKCGSRENLTLDHVIPESIGGSDCDLNLATMCEADNNAKRNTIRSYRNDRNVDTMIENFLRCKKNGDFGHKFDPNKVDRAKRHAEEIIRVNREANSRR